MLHASEMDKLLLNIIRHFKSISLHVQHAAWKLLQQPRGVSRERLRFPRAGNDRGVYGRPISR